MQRCGGTRGYRDREPSRALGGEDVLSRQLVGQMGGALWFLSGVVTLLTLVLPSATNVDRAGVMMVGIAAMLIGVTVWYLPWHRWHRRATLLLVPPAFALIGIHNHVAAGDPYRYGLFFIVAFVWIGVAHPRGTSLAMVPLLVPAYIIPLFTTGHGTAEAISSVAYVVPVCVGEIVAWVSNRLRQTQERLMARRSEERFRSLVQNSSDVIAIVRPDGMIQYLTPSITRVFGFHSRDLVGRHLTTMLHPDDHEAAIRFLADLAAGDGVSDPIECRMRHRDGSWRYTETIGQALLDDPNVRGLVLNTRDITERKLLEERLRQQAFHDSLSNLPNRTLFMDRLNHALRRAERRGHGIALMFLDLDNFKSVNDHFGHTAGDALLVAVAGRLRSCLRPEDTAARLGGDEFTVLLEDVTDQEDVTRVAERILEVVNQPVVFGEQEMAVTASLGIMLAHGADETLESLLYKADVAMYRIKQHGKAGYAVFDPTLDGLMLNRFAGEQGLRRAV
jgi:diguanylate cyclase (GGDEF)-like protein/PAS domain S-box-containing protein